MNELSLFTGAGGGLLGTYLLEWHPVGYVEWNDYCQRIIAARIRDGILPDAPIFGDVRAFISEGYAASYTGLVDVITGGFPCQPFSLAGKQLGADDPRNMWPATREVVSVVRPQYCLFENVPGLLNSGYFGTVVRDLAESGYCVRWRILSAAEMGAPHQRDRLWIVAHTKDAGRIKHDEQYGCNRREWTADTKRTRFCDAVKCSRATVANAEGRQGRTNGASSPEFQQSRGFGTGSSKDNVAHSQRDGNRAKVISSQVDGTDTTRPTGRVSRPSWWAVEPDVDRVVNGLASRVDRLKAIGNGQVPAVVRAAWYLLTEEIDR